MEISPNTSQGSPEQAKAKIEETPDVDICFMLDCTGSMSSYIKMSCDKIKDIIAQVKELYPKSEIWIGIVAYRDIGDQGRFEVLSFINSADKAKAFLGGLRASGGGDTPEDVNGAFQKALFEMKWQSPVRILAHIADAPCHGKEFHNCDDTYPKGHKEDMSWDKIFKQLVDLRLDFLFLKISNITDLMFTKFKAMADKHGASELELSFTQEFANQSSAQSQAASGGKAPAKAEDHFAATIAHTIKTSLHKEMKKGLANKLTKRVTENGQLMINVKKGVAETVTKLDFDDLKKKYSDMAAKVGDCILSSNNFIDALADEDCLCLTFDIGRSQAAIADPTQIIIKNVYPSFLTAGSFFYSTEFALKKDKLAHGGFEKHAEGLILKGAAQENITGVMPLYFCEENWRVAKQLMKLTIAWDVTLDPLGYSYSQMKTVPFLILAKLAEMMHEKPSNEFLKFQFELVKKTCMQIMEDGSKEGFEVKFNKEVMDLYSKYLKDTSVRTIDAIANNSVFLAQLYIAMECGARKNDNEFDEFFKALLEEELRRRQRSLPDEIDTTEWLLKIVGVDIENLIAKPVKQFIDSQNQANKKDELSSFGLRFLAALRDVDPSGSKEESVFEEKKIETVSEPKANPRTKETSESTGIQQSLALNGSYNETQNNARDEYNNTLKFVMRYLYPLRMLFTNKEAENPFNFKEWGIQTDDQFFSLYIQNKLHSKNSSRREAFKDGVYRNPWTQSREFLQNWHDKLVKEEKQSRIDKYLNGVRAAKDASQINIFAYTDNLNEAAGALMGVRIGLNVMGYWNKLCEGDATLPEEKIRMMLTGRYRGVKLYSDTERWRAGKRNMSKMFRGNRKMFERGVAWVDLM